MPINQSNQIKVIKVIKYKRITKRKKGLSPLMRAFLKEQREIRFIPHPFKSMSHLCGTLGLARKNYDSWHLCDCELGHIDGLPDCYGLKVATDGIMVMIYSRLSGKVSYGHIAHFVHDNNVWEVELNGERLPYDPPAYFKKLPSLASCLRIVNGKTKNSRSAKNKQSVISLDELL